MKLFSFFFCKARYHGFETANQIISTLNRREFIGLQVCISNSLFYPFRSLDRPKLLGDISPSVISVKKIPYNYIEGQHNPMNFTLNILFQIFVYHVKWNIKTNPNNKEFFNVLTLKLKFYCSYELAQLNFQGNFLIKVGTKVI